MDRRLTILVAANAEGAKLPLLCIGRVELPRWPVVMGQRAASLVPYNYSQKGWMVERLWTDWLKTLDNRMQA